MRIEAHKLVGVAQAESPNYGGAIAPIFIVMHYTGSFEAGGAILHLCNSDADRPVSAHVVVDVDGSVTQLVPFNVQAWHAGRSHYVTPDRGFSNLNDFSVGIEIVNPGWFTLSEERAYLLQGKQECSAELCAAFEPMLLAPLDGRDALWARYPERQLAAVEKLACALIEAYPTIQYVVGHHDIAPDRKCDPGPAFPLARFRALVKQ